MAKNKVMNRGLKRKVEDESSDFLEEDKVTKNAVGPSNQKNSSSKKSKIAETKKKDNTKTKYKSKD